MHLNGFDLNLLIALDALLREQNVTRAAERVYITQPSMSGALQRLREHFKDELLVRVGREMELTPRALALVEPVRELLLLAQATLERDDVFDPKTANRRFTLVMSDYCSAILVPPLVRRLATEAPNIHVQVEPLSSKPLALVEAGEADFCIVPDDTRLFGPDELGCAVHRQLLFSDRLICTVSEDNPRVGDSLTREQSFELPHVSAHFGGLSMHLEQFTLGHRWTEVTVAATAPGFVTALAMVAGTPFITTVQRRLAEKLAPSLGVRMLEPPIALPELNEMLIWHERNEFEQGHRWFRHFVVDVGTNLTF